MDWFHCNSCYIHPRHSSSRNKHYFLASCGHTYCEDCLYSENGKFAKECKVCQKKITVFPLSGEEPDAEILEYFKNVNDVLSNLLKIAQFQKDHRDRLTTYMNSVHMKYRTMKEERNKVKETIAAYQRKLRELELENQTLKKKTMSPAGQMEFSDKSNRSVSFNFTPAIQSSPFTSDQPFTPTQENHPSPSPRVWANRLTLPVRKLGSGTPDEANSAFSHGLFGRSFK